MPRFQSRLFNWIDRSLPAQLGRSARRLFDQKFEQLGEVSTQDLPRLFAYQVAKAALYPVYLIASTAKRTFPALNRNKIETLEQLRSQPDSGGLLPESDQTVEILEKAIEQDSDLPNPEIPLILSPLAKFLNWLDHTKCQLDRNIAAIVKRQPDNLTTSSPKAENFTPSANRIFAEIWQQQVEQGQADRDALPESNRSSENVALGKNTKLEQLKSLIEAAIAYFISKRSLDGDRRNIDQRNINIQEEKRSGFLSGESADKIQTSSESSLNQDQNSNSESSNSLKVDDRLDRLQKLIEDAIAYFFSKQLSQPTLDETSDITPNESAWLTMEDVFGDDNGPWPLPLEYESQAFTKSLHMTAIHSSGELQNFETTTSQISEDRLEGSLVFIEELLTYSQELSKPSESDRPLKAWIESQASILGYAYNPVMTIVLWIDTIILSIENSIIVFWKGLINFPKRLIDFIRYGNRT